MPSPWTSNLFQDRRGPASPPATSRTRADFAKQNRGGLARYLFVALLPLVLGPLITFALLAYPQAQADITRQVTAQLTSIATLKQNQVDQWATSRAVDMDNLARSPDILGSAQTLVFGDAPNMGTASQALRDRLESYLANTSNADFKGLLLARADTGKVVLATSLYQPLVGEVLKEKTYLEAARNGPFLAPPLYDPQLDSERIVIVAGAPVVDQQQGSIAVVLGILRDEPLLGIVQPNPGLGLSGRAYVVTHQGYQLGSAPNFRPHSQGIQRALRDHQNGNATYADPDGRRVLGVYRWLPRLGLALLVEQSATEAYQPITRLAFVLALIALLAILVSSAGVFLVTRQLTRPIQALTQGAQRLAGGDLSGRVMIQRGDEIGLLAQAFNSMAEQLQASYQDLEDKIESRTRQLETAAEVGRAWAGTRPAPTGIVSSDELLSRTVELIRARFGYYHASVFLLDEASEHAVLRAATGEVGAKLLARGYRLAVGSHSMVGWVTAHRQARVALDVSQDPFHLKNELLPDTRSEAAIPLNVGDRVIGALDVQSREPNAFTQADLHALQILADQVAGGVENSRLFARQAQIMRLEQLVANLTSKIHSARRLDTILESAATELGRALGARRVVVRLGSAPESNPPDRAAGGTPSEPTHGNGRRNANGEP